MVKTLTKKKTKVRRDVKPEKKPAPKTFEELAERAGDPGTSALASAESPGPTGREVFVASFGAYDESAIPHPVGAEPTEPRPLAELAPDPDNPRVITGEALVGLGNSMEDYGDLSGIVWNRRTGQLVCGHQRVQALQRAGAAEWIAVPQFAGGVIVHPLTREEFPIRIVDWDADKQRRANLLANSPHLAGEFTEAALEQLRAMEHDAHFEALRLGELEKELAARFAGEEESGGEGGDSDTAPEPPAEPFTRSGDMWIMGEHRLLCGDSSKAEDVARLLEGERPALGLHDPPYGINVQHKDGRIGSSKPWGSTAGRIIGAKVYPHIIGDDKPFDPAHLLDSGDVVVLWGANHYANRLPASAAWLVWVKRPDMEQNNFSDAELAWVSEGGSVRVFSYVWSGLVREGKTEEGPVRVHPTQKPIALYAWAMEQYTEKGALVYDAYAGSGPAVLAGEKVGRRVRVMEMAPAYCDVIVARWEAFTGRRALLRRGDEPEREAFPARPADPENDVERPF